MDAITDEDRYRTFVLAGADVVYRMRADWSDVEQLHGRAIWAGPSKPDQNWLDGHMPANDKERVAAAIKRAIENKRTFELEHAVRRRDGTIGWILSRAVPILGPDGQISEWLGTATDLSAPEVAAERLPVPKDLLRQFGENSPDTLWIIDSAAARFEYLSPAYETMWGEPRERVMHDPDRWIAQVHPDDRQGVLERRAVLLAGGSDAIEYRILRADGESRWIRDTGFPIRDTDARIVKIAGIAQDVTARRAAEDVVRASEWRLRTLTEGIAQLVWRAAADGWWTWASPQWTDFTGQSEAESRGWGWLKMVHPEDRDVAQVAWDRTRVAGNLEADYRLHHQADGKFRWFKVRAAPVCDNHGDVVEWLGTFTDIDDLRNLHERQKVLHTELQHRVRNSLAVIRSIVRRTVETSDSVEELSMHLDGRLGAFARVQAAATRDPTAGVDLRATVTEELLVHHAREGERARLDGPQVTLRAKSGETLALAFHELTTNSVKFGALSGNDGVVNVRWRIESDAAGHDWLAISWSEDHPNAPVPASHRRGFGTELLEDTLRYELEAETLLVHRPQGLLCTISLPFTDDVGEMG